IWQSEPQPSPASVLPSSQPSLPSLKKSPHSTSRQVPVHSRPEGVSVPSHSSPDSSTSLPQSSPPVSTMRHCALHVPPATLESGGSHCSPRLVWSTSSPHSSTTLQSALQPIPSLFGSSPSMVPPSSQISLPSTFPSPHSTSVQAAVHSRSGNVSLPSHASPGSLIPFPHTVPTDPHDTSMSNTSSH